MTTTTETKPARREFIPKLRDQIVGAIPGHPEPINDAIDRWRDGATEPANPFEAGVWSVCDDLARRLDEFDDERGAGS